MAGKCIFEILKAGEKYKNFRKKKFFEKSPTSGGHMGVVPNFPEVIRNERITQISSSIQSTNKKWSLIEWKKSAPGCRIHVTFFIFFYFALYLFQHIPKQHRRWRGGDDILNRFRLFYSGLKALVLSFQTTLKSSKTVRYIVRYGRFLFYGVVTKFSSRPLSLLPASATHGRAS